MENGFQRWSIIEGNFSQEIWILKRNSRWYNCMFDPTRMTIWCNTWFYCMIDIGLSLATNVLTHFVAFANLRITCIREEYGKSYWSKKYLMKKTKSCFKLSCCNVLPDNVSTIFIPPELDSMMSLNMHTQI